MHGVGGAQDLPLPPELAIAGAVAALTLSFTVLALAWRSPRYDPPRPGRLAPHWLRLIVDSTAVALLARAVGLVAMAYTVWVAVAGPNLLLNPLFGIVYILLWVGLVPLSLVFGPFYRAISPVRTIALGLARLARIDPEEGIRDYPPRWGSWPAAVGLFAFTWLELVYPHSADLGPVRLWFAGYAMAMVLGGLVFGQRFFEYADPFEVYSTLVAKVSPWARDKGGQLILRSPLANLATVPVRPGLLAVTAVLFGSTAFDSFASSPLWADVVQDATWPQSVGETAVLLGFCLLVGGLFFAACAATPARAGLRRAQVPTLLAHSLVPIIIGYIAAHYLTLLVEQGMLTVTQLSDPMVTGANLLGTADWSVNFFLSNHPTMLAITKVLGVVLGHLLGVVAAHDRALSVLRGEDQLTGQLPLLVVMVLFTAGGLYLLFAA